MPCASLQLLPPLLSADATELELFLQGMQDPSCLLKSGDVDNADIDISIWFGDMALTGPATKRICHAVRVTAAAASSAICLFDMARGPARQPTS